MVLRVAECLVQGMRRTAYAVNGTDLGLVIPPQAGAHFNSRVAGGPVPLPSP
jgi:hypothetical protein